MRSTSGIVDAINPLGIVKWQIAPAGTSGLNQQMVIHGDTNQPSAEIATKDGITVGICQSTYKHWVIDFSFIMISNRWTHSYMVMAQMTKT